MPSKSPAQKRLMQAVAHTAGGYDGVPQSVGKEFVAADKRGSPKSRDEHMARTVKHQSQKATGKEFGVSQPTVSRRVMRAGYSKIGGK